MKKRRLKKFSAACLAIVIILQCAMYLVRINTEFYLPSYKHEDITKSLDLKDCERLFRQTGLSGMAAEEFIKNGDIKSIESLNKLIFKYPTIDKDYILYPICAEEKNKLFPVPMASLKDGDILVCFSTHTANWRHGHLAIVTDACAGIILEHMAIGELSTLSMAKSWSSYSNFAILRYPDEEIAKKAADYALDSLKDIPYSIFAGLIKKDKSEMEKPNSSHCSHIVWQAYMAQGIDLDSNGGRIVTPKDVAMSDKLKAVQIYGLNPDKYIDRILR